MEDLIDIAKMLLPAIAVLVTAFYVMKKFFENEDRKRTHDGKRANTKQIIPIRLQAYERMVLFLERISPDSIVMRVHKKGMSARALQTTLLQTIRSEFEHNIAQQVYVSNAGWDLSKRAKEEMIKLVNVSASKVNDNATGIELSKYIFGHAAEYDKLPTQIAIEYLKKEIRHSF